MFEDYDEKLTLDREDVNGGYNKENCRWVGMDIQMHNKRKMKDCLFGIVGCHYNNARTRLVATIGYKGVSVYLATFDSVEDVAKAYDDASENLYKDRPNGTVAGDDRLNLSYMQNLERKVSTMNNFEQDEVFTGSGRYPWQYIPKSFQQSHMKENKE